jgi:rhodanese-related sulfurtransferase
MKIVLRILCALVFLAIPSTSLLAYNQDLAASYETFFEPFAGKATAKNLQMMQVPDFVAAVKNGEKLVVLDTRTPAETGIFVMSTPDTLVIPMNEVFKAENLARIPTEQKLVVVCKAGHRATAVAMALRHIGFEKVFVLKGGAKALVAYLTPKLAY